MFRVWGLGSFVQPGFWSTRFALAMASRPVDLVQLCHLARFLTGCSLGFRVWDLGFGVWGLGFRGLGFGV